MSCLVIGKPWRWGFRVSGPGCKLSCSDSLKLHLGKLQTASMSMQQLYKRNVNIKDLILVSLFRNCLHQGMIAGMERHFGTGFCQHVRCSLFLKTYQHVLYSDYQHLQPLFITVYHRLSVSVSIPFRCDVVDMISLRDFKHHFFVKTKSTLSSTSIDMMIHCQLSYKHHQPSVIPWQLLTAPWFHSGWSHLRYQCEKSTSGWHHPSADKLGRFAATQFAQNGFSHQFWSCWYMGSWWQMWLTIEGNCGMKSLFGIAVCDYLS